LFLSRDFVKFYLNGAAVEVRGSDALLMTADWLRKSRGMCGTKIVCAEGDCGACGVLLFRPKTKTGERLFDAVNSCIYPVANLDGCCVVTVEGLTADGQPSPVQDAMVRSNGSQCGYCTPGFVVAMTALFERHKSPDARQTANYLTGNLCRCTGYSPILAAAADVKSAPSLAPRFATDSMVQDLLNVCAASIAIRADRLEFQAPATEAAAAELKVKFNTARLLGAATDLGVQINKGKPVPPLLLSLSKIPALDEVKVSAGRMSVGANVTLTELRRAAQIVCPEFARFLDIFASPQIKNVATLVGNLANASPIGDTLPFLLVADAEVVALSQIGRRKIPIKDFFVGYRQTALKPDELIVAVDFLLPKAPEQLVLRKVSMRKDLDISAISAAILVSKSMTGIDYCRIAFGGVAATPVRLFEIEKALNGCHFAALDLVALKKKFLSSIKPISDLRGSADYRWVVGWNLLRDVLTEIQSPPGTGHLRAHVSGETLPRAVPGSGVP
jgi:xanthine dehydrogenase small subunit